MSSYIEITVSNVAFCSLQADNCLCLNMYFLYQALVEHAYSLHLCYMADSNCNLHVGYLGSADRDDR